MCLRMVPEWDLNCHASRTIMREGKEREGEERTAAIFTCRQARRSMNHTLFIICSKVVQGFFTIPSFKSEATLIASIAAGSLSQLPSCFCAESEERGIEGANRQGGGGGAADDGLIEG